MAISVATNSAWRETFDKATYALNVVDYAHHEIHAGSNFAASYVQDVGNAGTINVTIKTPNTTKWAHMLWVVDTELEAELRFYEASTTAGDGATITPVNRNRNSAATSTCAVMGTPTVGTVGDLLFTEHMGGGAANARFGGESRGVNEWVLKQNTTYTVQMVNAISNAANYMTVILDWYEHTNKE